MALNPNTLSAMEGEHRREHVVEEEEADEEQNEEEADEEQNEEEGENVELVDNPVAIDGFEYHLREREIRQNALGLGADDAALRDPMVTDLGTPTDPILVGDLPIHDSEYEEEAIEEEADEEDEEEEGENDEMVDNPVGIDGVEHDLREREIRLNAIGLGAHDAAPRDPIVTDLGTPTDPILVGDLPIHGFEYQEILRTCPPL